MNKSFGVVSLTYASCKQVSFVKPICISSASHNICSSLHIFSNICNSGTLQRAILMYFKLTQLSDFIYSTESLCPTSPSV